MHLSKHIDGTAPRANPHVSQGRGVIRAGQQRCDTCKELPLSWQRLITGEALHVQGREYMGDLCKLNFAANLKLL